MLQAADLRNKLLTEEVVRVFRGFQKHFQCIYLKKDFTSISKVSAFLRIARRVTSESLQASSLDTASSEDHRKSGSQGLATP